MVGAFWFSPILKIGPYPTPVGETMGELARESSVARQRSDGRKRLGGDRGVPTEMTRKRAAKVRRQRAAFRVAVLRPKMVKEQTDALFMGALEYAQQVGERSTEPIH
jgi:hypothetical protein